MKVVLLKKTYCFDIDGTICSQEEPENYGKATPNIKIINKINELYDKKNRIYLFTGRHMQREEITTQWLEKNGVKYHHIFFGKPVADVYIDDRAMTPEQFLALDE